MTDWKSVMERKWDWREFPVLYFLVMVVTVFLAGCSSDEAQEAVDAVNVKIDSFKDAVAMKVRIKSTEEEVFESLARIKKLTEEYDPRKLKTEHLLMDQYRNQHLPLMLEWGTNLIKEKERFASDWKTHIAAVNEAPEVFRHLKTQYLVWASSQDDPQFKSMYEDMAEASESWAIAMEKRSVTLTEMHKNFVRKTKFIDDSVVFLRRLESFLKTIPDAGRAAELQKFMQDVDKYIEAFRQTINSFKEFSDKLKGTN